MAIFLTMLDEAPSDCPNLFGTRITKMGNGHNAKADRSKSDLHRRDL